MHVDQLLQLLQHPHHHQQQQQLVAGLRPEPPAAVAPLLLLLVVHLRQRQQRLAEQLQRRQRQLVGPQQQLMLPLLVMLGWCPPHCMQQCLVLLRQGCRWCLLLSSAPLHLPVVTSAAGRWHRCGTLSQAPPACLTCEHDAAPEPGCGCAGCCHHQARQGAGHRQGSAATSPEPQPCLPAPRQTLLLLLLLPPQKRPQAHVGNSQGTLARRGARRCHWSRSRQHPSASFLLLASTPLLPCHAPVLRAEPGGS